MTNPTTTTRPIVGDEGFLRALEQLSLSVRRVARPGLNGDHRGLTRSNSAEFADYRSYSPGDDFRRIDWNLYGRIGQLFVRLAEAREDIQVHLLLDASRSMDYGNPNKLGYAKRITAALGYLALARLDAVSVATLASKASDRFGALRGKSRAMRLFSHLDAVNATGVTDLNAAMKHYADIVRPNGLVVLVSDLLATSGFKAGLERLRAARLEVTVLHILAPQELDPSEAEGDIELIDRETGEVVEVTLTDNTLRQYRQRLQTWIDEQEQVCHQLGVAYAQISTATPVENALLNDLRARRIVR